MGVLCSGFGSDADAQPVNLRIREVSGKVSVSWPTGLRLVQPEFMTNLSAGKWQDLGGPTESTNLVEVIAPGQAFYRLRFLIPRIQTQPIGQSLATGGSVSLNVAAIGTAPLTYQWRKDGVNVGGQTGAVYSLNAVSVSDAAGYSVMVANPVGVVTSVVAVVTVTNAPTAAPPQGIYVGNFAGQTNGGFAALFRTNGPGIVLAHNIALIEGVFATNIAVALNGDIAAVGEKLGKVTGNIGPDMLEGAMTATNGVTVAFTATRKPGAGIHQSNAGFYAGTFGGLLTGGAFFILAADGTAFTFLTSPTLGSGGAFGTIDPSNSFAAIAAYTLPGATVPALIDISGTLNSVGHVFSGTYTLSGLRLGTFSLIRIVVP